MMTLTIGRAAAWVVGALAVALAHPALGNDGAVRKLQEERLGVLREVARHARALYEAGSTTLTTVDAAERELWAAELELTDVPAKRVEILGRALGAARTMEEYAQKRHETGTGNGLEARQAKAARLQVEIELAKERGKAAAAAK